MCFEPKAYSYITGSLWPGSGGWHLGKCLYFIMGVVVLYILHAFSMQVIMALWLSRRDPANVEKVCPSWGLHQIEVSIFLLSNIPKAIPRRIHFTPGNSFLGLSVHTGLKVRRKKHGMLKSSSNDGFVISQWAASFSLGLSVIVSPQLPPSLLVFFSASSTDATPYLALFHCLWQLQTLLAVIG